MDKHKKTIIAIVAAALAAAAAVGLNHPGCSSLMEADADIDYGSTSGAAESSSGDPKADGSTG